MKRHRILFLFFFISIAAKDPAGVFILVHGTWGNKSEWYRPEGAFYKALETSAQTLHCVVVPFMWAGNLDRTSRNIAGSVLVKLIQSYPTSMKIHIVAHSHGGNVAIIASQILNADQNNKHCIETLFTLGTPINTKEYMPAMQVIKKLYNLFSLEDKIQPILGFFDREFPAHHAIANIRVFIESKQPGHTQFLAEAVGHWIPFIHENLKKRNIGNFEYFEFNKPGAIYFYNNYQIQYYIETSRKNLLAIDKQKNKLIAQIMIEQK